MCLTKRQLGLMCSLYNLLFCLSLFPASTGQVSRLLNSWQITGLWSRLRQQGNKECLREWLLIYFWDGQHLLFYMHVCVLHFLSFLLLLYYIISYFMFFLFVSIFNPFVALSVVVVFWLAPPFFTFAAPIVTWVLSVPSDGPAALWMLSVTSEVDCNTGTDQ